MKGLLIKDFKLMKMQKTFFLLILAITVGMTVFSFEISFILGYLPFVISLFSASTISYDEFDNGNAFLFSLPVTRKAYVMEKYIFSLILSCGSWILALLIAAVNNFFRESIPASELITTALMILPVLLTAQAVLLPFQLKFGAEKGRIAMIAAIGLLFLIGFALLQISKAAGIDPDAVVSNLPTTDMGMLIAVILGISILFLILSERISTSIMNKKEF